eukprot:85231_1
MPMVIPLDMMFMTTHNPKRPVRKPHKNPTNRKRKCTGSNQEGIVTPQTNPTKKRKKMKTYTAKFRIDIDQADCYKKLKCNCNLETITISRTKMKPFANITKLKEELKELSLSKINNTKSTRLTAFAAAHGCKFKHEGKTISNIEYKKDWLICHFNTNVNNIQQCITNNNNKNIIIICFKFI